MRAPQAVALSPFDARLRDNKMWGNAMSHFLGDGVWHCALVLYVWLCMHVFVQSSCISRAMCDVWCASVRWRICVWVHSYVCIFKMIVFRHVTPSTFYTCGVISNACSVHKCDYVNAKGITWCWYACLTFVKSCLRNYMPTIHCEKRRGIWTVQHKCHDNGVLSLWVCAPGHNAASQQSPSHTLCHSSALITAVDLSPMLTINACML